MRFTQWLYVFQNVALCMFSFEYRRCDYPNRVSKKRMDVTKQDFTHAYVDPSYCPAYFSISMFLKVC
jgi:hypothetical protein